MNEAKVILKAKRADILLSYRHPWVFSKGLAAKVDVPAGTQVRVVAQNGKHLGWGFYHPRNPIAIRMVSFGKDALDDAAWRAKIEAVYKMRRAVLPEHRKNFRLIHGENDGFPGLTVDVFNKLICMQVTSSGFEGMKQMLAEHMAKICGAEAVYERSEGHARKQEGLPTARGFLVGEMAFPMEIEEQGFRQEIDPASDQKTGFFLDQYHQRAWVEKQAAGRSVLDLFCYTGGFSLAALRGGAKEVLSVDVSSKALGRLKYAASVNGLDTSHHEIREVDIFSMLKQKPERTWDLVILDPPSLAKSVGAADNARKAYRKLHRAICEYVAPGGILLTFSCSGVVSRDDFQRSVFLGLQDAHREGLRLTEFDAGADHPVHLCFPEGAYLKGMALYMP